MKSKIFTSGPGARLSCPVCEWVSRQAIRVPILEIVPSLRKCHRFTRCQDGRAAKRVWFGVKFMPGHVRKQTLAYNNVKVFVSRFRFAFLKPSAGGNVLAAWKRLSSKVHLNGAYESVARRCGWYWESETKKKKIHTHLRSFKHRLVGASRMGKKRRLIRRLTTQGRGVPEHQNWRC